MKVYFIWGFLGSGKTTLINYLLAHVFEHEKVVVLENESGGRSVDGAFLAGNRCVVRELNAGCICCTLKMQLPEMIRKIEKEEDPDVLLVETSGLASLEAIYSIPQLRMDGVFSLLDVSRYPLLMKINPQFYTRQYALSPVILLTKTEGKGEDDVSVAELKEQYSSNGRIVEDYRTLSPAMWHQIAQEALPFRRADTFVGKWPFCKNKTYVLDNQVDTDCCIQWVQLAMAMNRDSLFRAKGLLRNEEGRLCKYDIWETTFSCEELKIGEDAEVPFLSFWWDKYSDSTWTEWFRLFFETNEMPCAITADEIDDKEIWNYMGGAKFVPGSEVKSMVKEMESEALSLCEPRIGYRLFSGHIAPNGRLIVGSNSFNPKGIIKKYLENCDAYTLLVATVGKRMNEWIQAKHASSDIMEAYIADILGSVIVEAVAAKAICQLEDTLNSVDWKVTNSYSPGYCGWDVSEQQILFSMLPHGVCGVHLSASSLMEPIKSISAVIGVGKNVEKKPYGCKICKKKDCYKRRIANMDE